MASEEGSEIKIDIDEVSLANSFQTQLGIADSVLAGDVAVSSDNALDDAQNYNLKSRSRRRRLSCPRARTRRWASPTRPPITAR